MHSHRLTTHIQPSAFTCLFISLFSTIFISGRLQASTQDLRKTLKTEIAQAKKVYAEYDVFINEVAKFEKDVTELKDAFKGIEGKEKFEKAYDAFMKVYNYGESLKGHFDEVDKYLENLKALPGIKEIEESMKQIENLEKKLKTIKDAVQSAVDIIKDKLDLIKWVFSYHGSKDWYAMMDMHSKSIDLSISIGNKLRQIRMMDQCAGWDQDNLAHYIEEVRKREKQISNAKKLWEDSYKGEVTLPEAIISSIDALINTVAAYLKVKGMVKSIAKLPATLKKTAKRAQEIRDMLKSGTALLKDAKKAKAFYLKVASILKRIDEAVGVLANINDGINKNKPSGLSDQIKNAEKILADPKSSDKKLQETIADLKSEIAKTENFFGKTKTSFQTIKYTLPHTEETLKELNNIIAVFSSLENMTNTLSGLTSSFDTFFSDITSLWDIWVKLADIVGKVAGVEGNIAAIEKDAAVLFQFMNSDSQEAVIKAAEKYLESTIDELKRWWLIYSPYINDILKKKKNEKDEWDCFSDNIRAKYHVCRMGNEEVSRKLLKKEFCTPPDDCHNAVCLNGECLTEFINKCDRCIVNLNGTSVKINCEPQNGWYCKGTQREFREYYCFEGVCEYTVSQTEPLRDCEICIDGILKDAQCSEKEYCCNGKCFPKIWQYTRSVRIERVTVGKPNERAIISTQTKHLSTNDENHVCTDCGTTKGNIQHFDSQYYDEIIISESPLELATCN